MDENQFLRDLYLDLVKRSLFNLLYGDLDVIIEWFTNGKKQYDFATLTRHLGHTMVGFSALTDVRMAVEDVIAQNVPGDLIETGVWRGGTSIYMRAILKAHGITDRRVWVADSFEGVPPPDVAKYPQDEGVNLHVFPDLAVSLDQVRLNFARYGLLDDQVRFLKGWFRDTLPKAPIGKLAVMRLDGDLYESTMDALVNLYPKLSVGGYVIIDDYGAIAACRQAVTDYRAKHGIDDPIVVTDAVVVYWRRSEAGPHFEGAVPAEPRGLAGLSILSTNADIAPTEAMLSTLDNWFYMPASERRTWQKIENQGEPTSTAIVPAPKGSRPTPPAVDRNIDRHIDVNLEALYAEIGRLTMEVKRLKRLNGEG